MNHIWQRRFIEMARLVSTWSKDPNTKVGAVIVSNDRRTFSTGYNGFPRGVDDNWRLDNRDIKRKLVIHAEANAIMNAPFDIKSGDFSLFVTAHPCHECAKQIIQAGIKRVYYSPTKMHQHWGESMELSQSLLSEAGVEVYHASE